MKKNLKFEIEIIDNIFFSQNIVENRNRNRGACLNLEIRNERLIPKKCGN